MFKKLRIWSIQKLASTDIACAINLEVNIGRNVDTAFYQEFGDTGLFVNCAIDLNSKSRYAIKQYHKGNR